MSEPHASQSSDKFSDKSADRPAGKPADKPARQSSDQPNNKPAHQSNGKSAQQAAPTWAGRLRALFSLRPIFRLKNREQLNHALDRARDNAVIDEDARGIIKGAMAVSNMKVRDVMIPRSQMQVLHSDEKLEQILPRIIDSAHSRYPVVGESPDDVRGILLVKDLLPQILQADNADFRIEPLLRPCYVVPMGKPLNLLLQEFRQNRNHMAIVIDEYGCVAGLATIEDVLEEIVGEIEDETDTAAETFIHNLGTGEYVVRAVTPIDEFNESLQASFGDDTFDTIGGLVTQRLGHLPKRGDTFSLDGYEFKVLEANERALHSLRVRPPQQSPQQSPQQKPQQSPPEPSQQ